MISIGGKQKAKFVSVALGVHCYRLALYDAIAMNSHYSVIFALR